MEFALTGIILVVFLAVVAWSLVWKGIALWKCGRNNQLGWFVSILIINTLGILEIIYLLWFQRKQPEETKK
ncbi:MAG: hypothetical protein HZA49_08660 [Planctomycetes bacterium]|nr:hypothetical protein [Planctomycetota bacterium]